MLDESARVAALYDIHGNLPALEAVLDDVRRADVDRIVVGGDIVPGPMPRECLDALLATDIPTEFIRGNCETAMLAIARGADPGRLPDVVVTNLRWSGEQLGLRGQRVASRWALTTRLRVGGLGDVLFCHATPRDDNEIFTEHTPESALRAIFDATAADVVVCGHTHMQFDRPIGPTRVINAGSLGMPFGDAGADWLLLGPGVELRHTAYDLSVAADRIRETTYPQAAEFAIDNVLQPPSRAQMLQAFSRAELKSTS